MALQATKQQRRASALQREWPERVGANENAQHHPVAVHLPHISRRHRIRNFSDAYGTAMFANMNAGDCKPSCSVEPDGPCETAVGAVIADGAAVRRERQSGMDSAPRAGNNRPTGRQRATRRAPAQREEPDREDTRDVSQLTDAP